MHLIGKKELWNEENKMRTGSFNQVETQKSRSKNLKYIKIYVCRKRICPVVDTFYLKGSSGIIYRYMKRNSHKIVMKL